ncbi:MAG: restriction endonuclease [Desulfomonilaceae bacterium]
MDVEDIEATFASMMLGAGEGNDLLLRMGVGFVHALDSDDRFALVDQRLRLRCILTSPEVTLGPDFSEERRPLYVEMYEQTISKLRNFGWDVRVVDRVPTLNCLITDRKEALLASLPAADRDRQTHTHFVADPQLVVTIQDHFDRLWEGSKTGQLVYEDLPESSIPAVASRIIVASADTWDRMISHLVQHPHDLTLMDPRKFEELVAELLSRHGMRVDLTQPSKDGGRDILAWAETAARCHLYLVECKRYGPNKPVGVALVRALYGVVNAENATGGVLVTTSRFTRGAHVFQESVQNRLWLRDYDGVFGWLKEARAIQHGYAADGSRSAPDAQR